MASNSSTEYRIVADRVVSPDEDIIVTIVGDVYKGSIAEPNKYATQSEFTSISTLQYAQFDTTNLNPSAAPGQLVWNNTDGTLEFQLKGGNVTLQIGQEQNVRVRNSTNANMTDGQVVYSNGSTGNFKTVALASANAEAASSVTLGVVTESIAKNTEGFVTTFGLVRNINTSSLTEGEIIWLGTTPGTMTTTKPQAPIHAVQVGLCVRSHPNQGVIFVKVQNGYELDELHNVKITNPQNNDVLKYNSALGVWVNAPA
jgi:hypothetical protein